MDLHIQLVYTSNSYYYRHISTHPNTRCINYPPTQICIFKKKQALWLLKNTPRTDNHPYKFACHRAKLCASGKAAQGQTAEGQASTPHKLLLPTAACSVRGRSS